MAGTKFVHIVGKPGSGKSHLARRLAEDLILPHLDIAGQPGHLTDAAQAWSALRARMTEPAIIESAGTSRYERHFWDGIESKAIICTAPDRVRLERLQARPEARSEPAYIRRMLAIPAPPMPGIPWDSTQPIPGPRYLEVVEAVQTFLSAQRFYGA